MFNPFIILKYSQLIPFPAKADGIYHQVLIFTANQIIFAEVDLVAVTRSGYKLKRLSSSA